jgi:alpha-glucoside transport system substrate-binding protein
MRWPIACVVGLAGLVPLACGPSDEQPVGLQGASVEVLAVWDDSEAVRFEQVLDRFEGATGAEVRYVSTHGEDIAEVLDARLAEGTPPDLAILPLPGLLRRYAAEDVIQPIGDLVGTEVADRYGPVWQDLASVGGSPYGVWFKAAHKSLIWYDVATFERHGVVPPNDLEGLLTLARTFSTSGTPAFALGARDAWTVTDWFENLYLRTAGPERYDDLAERRIPWTHPSVRETLHLLGRLLRPGFLAGGPTDPLRTTFPQSVEAVFGDETGAAMLGGGDFVAGFITAETAAEVGVDADVFLFPEAGGSGRLVVGGGDVVVALRRSTAADEVVRYLASAEAAEVWAALGGFVSPNGDVDLASYPDERTRTIARSLLEAGDGFRFDLSDLQPVAFGGTRGEGMLGILADFVRDPADVARTARRLEAAAAAATGVTPG